MGITGIIKEFPGGDYNNDLKHGLDSCDVLKNNRIDMDMGTLVFSCAIIHKAAFIAGDYKPAVTEFQRRLVLLTGVYGLDINCVFDGQRPYEKRHEHARRSNSSGITITSNYIAMCIRVCKRFIIDNVVVFEEADAQVGRCKVKAEIIICNDSDELALGNKKVVVDNFNQETYRYIDMTVPITDKTMEEHPLYYYYHKYGIKIIHWWAATLGCDISESKSGDIIGAGRKAFMDALESFENKDQSLLDTHSFARALRKHGTSKTRLLKVSVIEKELTRVSNWFTNGSKYYDCSGNVLSVDGTLIESSSNISIRHMNGELDTRERTELSSEDKISIDLIQPHNLLHNSAVDTNKIKGISLPNNKSSLTECVVPELKAMIVARGGGLTSRDGKAYNKDDLILHINAYQLLEEENPTATVYFDRSETNNGSFAQIDTSQSRNIPQMLAALIKCNSYEPSLNKLFCDVEERYRSDKVVEDFETIALTAPEMPWTFIQEECSHISDDMKQKNCTSSLKKVMEMETRLYHANATADNNKSIFIISKQRASQITDRKTNNKTGVGERPLFAEYLVIMELSFKETTNNSHGHTLGVFTRVRRHFCAICKAGCGFCIHKASCLWMQHLHWGEGRPTERPSTVGLCSWIPGSGQEARTCSTVKEASSTHILQLPSTPKEAEERENRGIQKNMHQGIAAKYDIYGANKDKWAKLDDPRLFSKERASKLFSILRLDNNV